MAGRWCVLAALLLPSMAAAADAPPLPPDTTPPERRTSAPPQAAAPPATIEAPGGAPAAEAGVDIRAYTRKDGARITEYARHGRVYMIKVEPPGGLPPYYLYDDEGDGRFRRLPGGYRHPAPPQWILREF
ncbi:MAG: DUF2782 domain-containing protein [Zetaproteobacteria bacterium]|nr:MAG: DUF2782 domain-containing protein [Zetaproteobacteria bacterium]